MITSRLFWKKVQLLLLFFCLIMVVTVPRIGILLTANTASSHASSPDTVDSSNTPEQVSSATNKNINILLLGLDDGDFDNPNSPRRSDTMIVASINPQDKTINLLSIPRDSRVSIPGYQGYDKITHAFFYGGPNLAVRTVESFLNIPIDHYIVIDWQAFIKVVDVLGGVNINVERAMNYDDPYENLSIHLSKGYQHLDGQNAGEYVRFRHDELGDIGRVQRQENFITALESQLLQTGTIFKLPSLITTINRYVHTDMNIYTMVQLAEIVKDVPSDGMHTDMLPGDFATIDDLSYWVPNMAQTRRVVRSMFTGSTEQQSSQAKIME